MIDKYLLNTTIFLSAALLLSLFTACSDNPLEVDLQDVHIDLTYHRLDQDFFDKNVERLDTNAIDQLEETYGAFFQTYTEEILGEGYWSDPMFLINLNRFRDDLGMNDIQESINKEFNDISREKQALTQAFRHYHYYFPDSIIPEIVLFNSGYNFAIYPSEKHLGIGLEWFIGPEKDIIKRLPNDIFPNYIKKKMKREYFASDAMKGWLLVNFYEEIENADFISQVVFYGKIMYLLDAMMPTTPDSIKMNYTAEQAEWVEDNEKHIWKYLVEQDMLFSHDQKEISKFVQEAPFTSGLHRESPPKVGVWLGWQMVRAHMNRTPELTLHDLIDEKNYKRIMKSYKPKK